MIHTVKMAAAALSFIKSNFDDTAVLIGSLSKGEESNHDIDVLIAGRKRDIETRDRLIILLHPTEFEYTDWGGIYFSNTLWGDIDIFFEYPKD